MSGRTCSKIIEITKTTRGGTHRDAEMQASKSKLRTLVHRTHRRRRRVYAEKNHLTLCASSALFASAAVNTMLVTVRSRVIQWANVTIFDLVKQHPFPDRPPCYCRAQAWLELCRSCVDSGGTARTLQTPYCDGGRSVAGLAASASEHETADSTTRS